MKKLAVIPSRYASTRFEGKPLADINGKPMVMWVYDSVAKSKLFDKVLVATDDERIEEVVKQYGGEVLMTSKSLCNGTQRCYSVLKCLEQAGEQYDIVVNVQGDEPLIKQEMIKAVIDGFDSTDADIVTLKKSIETLEDCTNPNVVKVVTSNDGTALYFSRSQIPYGRNIAAQELIENGQIFKHIGIYGYRAEVLKQIIRLNESFLQRTESLEQLCWLENGYKIVVKQTMFDTIGVDTPEDLQKIKMILSNNLIK